MRRRSGLQGLPSDEFRNVLSSAKRIAVVCHTDLDGLGAARILKHSSFGPKVIHIVTTDSAERDISAEQEADVLAASPDLIAFLDIAPFNYEQLTRMLSGRNGVIVDHHKPKDFARVPNLDARFIAHKLFRESPDHCSTTYLLAELLAEPYEPEYVVAALLGDENFHHFEACFECSEEELRLGYKLGLLYKQLGSIQPLSLTGNSKAIRIGSVMEKFAFETPSLQELDKVIAANETIQSFMELTGEDFERLMTDALAIVQGVSRERDLVLEFRPASGFFVSGFIYLLQKRIQEEQPDFCGILMISQEGESFWRLDGLCTDPKRSVGEVFTRSGTGGGHWNVGGGRLRKPGWTPQEWFEVAVKALRG